MQKKLPLLLLCFWIFGVAVGQRQSAEDYIEKYKHTAIREMQRTGIPASITLSQGILESGSGNSSLAKQGNNHFGIKCHGWRGRRIFKDDDLKDECFRKYKNANESFIDHSDFLTTKRRYAFLFDLDSKDYRSWARGLKKAGYATARDYATRLICLIERYELYRYDEISNERIVAYNRGQDIRYKKLHRTPIKDRIRYRNRVPYFVIKQGDTYEAIRAELGLKRKRIARYNDFSKHKPLVLGEPIYLKHKKRKTPRRYPVHIANGNETMHDISQRYAVRLKKLLSNNGMNSSEIPYQGQHIILR